MLVIMERSLGAPLRRAVLTLLPGANFQTMSLFFLKCKHRQDVGTLVFRMFIFVTCIWAKECLLMTVLCVLSDLTGLPLLGVGRKSWYIIIITCSKHINCRIKF